MLSVVPKSLAGADCEHSSWMVGDSPSRQPRRRWIITSAYFARLQTRPFSGASQTHVGHGSQQRKSIAQLKYPIWLKGDSSGRLSRLGFALTGRLLTELPACQSPEIIRDWARARLPVTPLISQVTKGSKEADTMSSSPSCFDLIIDLSKSVVATAQATNRAFALFRLPKHLRYQMQTPKS